MKIIKFLAVSSILILGIFLRFHNYDIYPQRGATSDEYSYSFLGVSLLTKGIPISWSHFDYPNKKLINIDGISFPIVSPYFDHPPLYALLVGGWSILFGDETIEEIDLKVVRIIPVILSTISSVLVFLVGNKLYGFKVGIWAFLIYVTTTYFIMNSRVVFAENLLTPLMLLSIYTYSSKKISIQKVIILGLLSGLSIWTKVLGIMVYITNILFLLIEKYKRKMIVTITAIFLVSVAAFVGYGFYFDKDLFLQIQGMQAGRDIGPRTLWTYTLEALIVNKPYINGWYFFGLISIFFLFSDFKKHKAIILPFFVYFSILLLTLTQEGHSSWYMIPLYPLMSIAIAFILSESIKKVNWIIMLFVIYIGMTHIQYFYEFLFGLSPARYRVLSLILIIPFILTYIFQKESLFRFLGNFWFYVFILGNIFVSYHYMHPS